MAVLLNGKKIGQDIKANLKSHIKRLPFKPGLAAILIGKDAASQLYLRVKKRACQELGIDFKKFSFASKAQPAEVLKLINALNKDTQIRGILLQLPLPKGWTASELIEAISFKKDVDGLRKKSPVCPPVIQAIFQLLKATKLCFSGKKAICLVNSKVFGQKLVEFLGQNGILAQSFLPGQESKSILQKADILISARGNPHFVKPQMIKKEVVLIDAGATLKKSRLLGDIDPKCYKKSSFYAPVPGGVGPLTVAFLLKNLVYLAKFRSF